MRIQSKVVVVLGALAIVVGGAAYAAVERKADPTPSASQQTFLQDVAKRLGVTEAALTDALKGAAVDQVDAALAAGRITKDEAHTIKARIEAGDALPLLGPGSGFDLHHRGA